MRTRSPLNLERLIRDESGQALPWMVILVILFLGMAGLTVDLGRAWVCYRELQASTDAAALAGAYAMTSPTATTATITNAACTYGSNTDTTKTSLCGSIAGTNQTPNLPSVTTATALSCIDPPPTTAAYYITVPCAISAVKKNVIRVTQSAVIPTYFFQALRAIGVQTGASLTLNAASSATLGGSTPPVNVAVILDSTGSMKQNDPGCGHEKIICALGGLQKMLGQLPPCAQTDSTGTCTAHNNVSLFTYPNVAANTAKYDTQCTPSKSPSVMDYTAPAQPDSTVTTWTPPDSTSGNGTYQITGFAHDFNTGSGTSLNGNSNLVIAAGNSGNCKGMQATGGVNTYFAGAINAAQTALQAQSNGTTSHNVIVILSDGDATATYTDFKTYNTSMIYPSIFNECQQGVAAAQNASANGTTVYVIAYAAGAGGCASDQNGFSVKINGKTYTNTKATASNLGACQTLKDMSTGWLAGKQDTSHFYSDTSGAPGGCNSVGGPSDLPSIFSSITADFSKARLIPNS